jgi:hypothetical protein
VPEDGLIYEIFIRKGDQGGPFVVEDPEVVKDYTRMFAIAKDLVNQKDIDEAVLLQKRVLKRFRKYSGKG